ncbi:MAG: NAD(+)/NADH kinase [Candidatus Omnitrophica bacterium]|nr:NAD(+)/NADH kinase [Candidatus Omnitrophota bacterium]MDE2009621.1 NAD(+)/NADH kinase [Candidatus Omnitrophota bacterium]MDE2214451.1 NAD(+)/NADH kinase [Candidatus Omnitrophota bacterium]MDE2231591.1 NAD(+)/NADH kinase [Candidatus Omnitrophota bacterium]
MNILLFYKNSTYAGYFLSDRRRLARLEGLLDSEEVERFRRTHSNHFWSLSSVEAVLKMRKLKFTKACRGSSLDYGNYDLIITVGGDGTFLEAARQAKKQIVWGINSDPAWSVGRFCCGSARNFSALLDRVLAGKVSSRKLQRLSISFSDGTQSMNVLNDILICHHNPAAISRYYLTVGASREEQRSSGVWIATAAGSSGGIHSAGGKILPLESKSFQYKPRELYGGNRVRYRLTGGVLKSAQKIVLTSLMREGVVFVDGSHVCLPFSFGTKVFVQGSMDPLKIIFE